MRKATVSVLFVIVILLAKAEVYSQTALPKDKSCQPTAEEILSHIKSFYSFSPFPEGVLIISESSSLRIDSLPQNPLSLFRVLSMWSGVPITSKKPIYLLRQSSDDETRIKFEIDLRDIKEGRAKALMLEKGDLIFVSRGCKHGQLLPPSKLPGVLITPPVHKINKRVAR